MFLFLNMVEYQGLSTEHDTYPWRSLSLTVYALKVWFEAKKVIFIHFFFCVSISKSAPAVAALKAECHVLHLSRVRYIERSLQHLSRMIDTIYNTSTYLRSPVNFLQRKKNLSICRYLLTIS